MNRSKYPQAEPGALVREPLKAAKRRNRSEAVMICHLLAADRCYTNRQDPWQKCVGRHAFWGPVSHSTTTSRTSECWEIRTDPESANFFVELG